MMVKKIREYFKKHTEYNAIVHAIGGIGVGILIASPLIDPHPVRWGLTLLVIAVAGHLYPLMAEK